MKEPFATGAIMKINTPAYRVHTATLLALEGLVTALLWLLPAAAQAQAIEAWVQLSDIPGHSSTRYVALALDASGNVVVSGPSLSGDGRTDDWLTIKYSSAGVLLWADRYNGPGNGDDIPGAAAVDASGNVYVTGGSAGVGFTDWYCATVKYSSAGEPLWTNRYNGGGNPYVALDAGGNVVVAGTTYNGANYDCLTIKYSSAGVPLWTKRYNGPGNGNDEPVGLAVDASGNVYVSAVEYGTVPRNGSTIKYSSAGALLWVRTFNGDPGGLALDHSVNVIVTGTTTNAAYQTIKYSSAGVPLWTNSYNEPAYGGSASAVGVDSNDNVYVTGGAIFSYSGDYATVKYSSAGVPLWTNRYSGPGSPSEDGPRALALDASGNVYVTGSSVGNGSDYDYLTVAYSSAGVPLWTNRYNGPGNKRDQPMSLAVDASGNVFVTGISETSESNGNRFLIATVKYVVPPIITGQPLSCSNSVGATAGFTVEVAGSAPFGYQWRRQGTNLVDGGNISGVTTANLLIANVQAADAVGYSVVVTNAYGSATSQVAQLTVHVPPNPGRFSNLSYSAETGLSFIFRDGTVGQPYRIQVAPSLEGGWVDWTSFNYTAPRLFTDMEAVGTSNRFYRAVSP